MCARPGRTRRGECSEQRRQLRSSDSDSIVGPGSTAPLGLALLTKRTASIDCGVPSSRSSKSACVKVSTLLPRLSVAMTSTKTAAGTSSRGVEGPASPACELPPPDRGTEDSRPRDCGLHRTGMRQQRQDGRGANMPIQPVRRKPTSSWAPPPASPPASPPSLPAVISDDVFARCEAIELDLDLRLRPGRLRGRHDKIVHGLSGAVQQPRLERGRHITRPVSIHPNEHSLGPAELSHGHRNGVRICFDLLEISHRSSPEQLRRRDMRHWAQSNPAQ